MKVTAFGVTVATYPGIEARVYRRTPDGSGEATYPVAHVATFALPTERGDFGGGAIELMGTSDVFLALVEFDPASARTALFGTAGVRPTLAPADFSPNQLQRVLPPRSGRQYFFTEAGRPFCLFAVLGQHSQRVDLVPVAQQLLDGIAIQPTGALAVPGASS